MINATEETRRPGEGLVVTENDRRVDGQVYQEVVTADQAAASRRKTLSEQSNDKSSVAVKQQLMG